MEIPTDVWIGLFALLALFLKAGIPPGATTAILCALCLSASAFADNNTPRLYATTGVELEAHHGALAGASDYGSILHVGADYGLLGVEGVRAGSEG